MHAAQSGYKQQQTTDSLPDAVDITTVGWEPAPLIISPAGALLIIPPDTKRRQNARNYVSDKLIVAQRIPKREC
jgi:hypothetical protein